MPPPRPPSPPQQEKKDQLLAMVIRVDHTRACTDGLLLRGRTLEELVTNPEYREQLAARMKKNTDSAPP